MSNEILNIINYLKIGIDSANSKNEEWLPVPLSHLLPLINELERINSLEPVGYIDNAEFREIESSRICYLYKDNIDKINIPLYRLDK